jgi:hypothetical protein
MSILATDGASRKSGEALSEKKRFQCGFKIEVHIVKVMTALN